MELAMAGKNNFESRFFDMLQDSVKEISGEIKVLSKKVDDNTTVTNSISKRVDKLDGKVFKRGGGSIASLIQDRQILLAFGFALLVFLLILANVLHVQVPQL